VTLRQAIGNAGRLHEFLEELLDQEDAVVLMFDGHRAVNHVNGFGLSPCQLELLALEIERAVRTVGVKETSHASCESDSPGH
jgi:hypothetical protein